MLAEQTIAECCDSLLHIRIACGMNGQITFGIEPQAAIA